MSGTAAVLCVALPGVGAVASLALTRYARVLALLGGMGTVAAVAALAANVSLQRSPVHTAMGGWRAPLGIELYADGLTVLMLSLTACIAVSTGIYATRYFEVAEASHEGEASRFWPLALLLWMGLNALFLANDAFNLYVTLEIVSLAGVALTALGGTRAARSAALRYLFAGMLASLLYLLGVTLFYLEHATLSLSALGDVAAHGRVTPMATALVLLGLLFKGALVPLHFWLPAAHAHAPAPVSALLSALVVKAALYLILRWWLDVLAPGLDWGVTQLVGAVGALAVVWGSVQALVTPHLKVLVAYSTVTQMGYVLLLFPLAVEPHTAALAWAGAVYLALSHGLAKAAMYLAAGNAMRLHGHDEIAALAGLSTHMPVSAFAIALAGVSLIGLPFSGGFIGKWLLLNAAFDAGQWWWVVVLALGTLLGAAYVLRVVRLIFVPGTHTPDGRLPAALEWPALALALGALVLGFTFTLVAPVIDIGGPGAAFGSPP